MYNDEAKSAEGRMGLTEANRTMSNTERILSELEREMSQLDKSIHILSERLSPVSTPSPQVGSGEDAEDRRQMSPLNESVENILRRLRSNRMRVETITSEIDL